MKQIGFIGTGVMGSSMVKNLMKNGFEVSVYTRTKSKAQEVVDAGAKWCDTVAECAKDKDAVITIVGFPKDVEQVYFGKDGIIENAKSGAYIIDMTTTSPTLSEKIYEAAKEKGLNALDAPVSGGDKGAREGILTIMVGGDKEAFDACADVFAAMGTSVVYEGKAGAGQHTKMVNQICISGAIAGVCEAIAYMNAKGLVPEEVFRAISKGAAGSAQLNLYANRIIEGDLNPGFYIKHFIKDMAIASEEAAAEGIKLDILDHVLDIYKVLENDGMGDLGTQGLIKHYEK